MSHETAHTEHNRCEKAADGIHVPDWTTLRPDRSVHIFAKKIQAPDAVFNVTCKLCGVLGFQMISATDLIWHKNKDYDL